MKTETKTRTKSNPTFPRLYKLFANIQHDKEEPYVSLTLIKINSPFARSSCVYPFFFKKVTYELRFHYQVHAG
ncbi:hypothetical protein EUGRSUZ_K01923 [Eucalyptus grandis]|uniref:Uncharacterized protein n=2 Tax=Eucalyptus grandis TaxID=71139 RepID=A0ACC3IWA3_EUCGR|nr:hypothetical protein EUGRSUZ_K01923 [Eucalyptus grandis]